MVERAVPILDPGCKVEDYGRYLRLMLGFHVPVEEALRVVPGLDEALPDASDRSKTALLESDLRACGFAPEEAPLCPVIPAVSRVPEALGCLYVLEGSTLGGMVLRRMLAPRLDPGGTAMRYLGCYGAGTAKMWETFGRSATRALISTEDGSEAVASARETFLCLHQWLTDAEAARA